MPGDKRGFVEWHEGWKPPNPHLEEFAKSAMKESALLLSHDERALIETTVGDHCQIRIWHLWAVSARSNHVHVVVTSRDYKPMTVRDQLKAWCSRRLKERFQPDRKRFWAEGGSYRCLFDEDSLAQAIQYTLDGQDKSRI